VSQTWLPQQLFDVPSRAPSGRLAVAISENDRLDHEGPRLLRQCRSSENQAVSTIDKPDASAIRTGYDRWAEIYDHEQNPLIALEEPVVREALGEVSGLSVLDLGCGTGRHALWLANRGARVTAIDFSEGMLAEARAKPGADGVRFLVHDLHRPLPFEAGAFDRVVSGLVLEHLHDLAFVFGEAHRVLAPGGHAVVSAMHPAMFLKGAYARFTDPATGEKVAPGSVPHQVGDFVMAAVHAGFVLEEIVEKAPDAEFAARLPRAEKYVGWPMLVVLSLRPGRDR
jgi:malonyl-CoA O-methyltransferase